MEQEVKLEYSVSIKDDQIHSQDLPAGVKIDQTTIIFDSSEPISMNLNIEMEKQDIEVRYILNPGVSVELIETRSGGHGHHLKRQIQVKENAHLAMLTLDESDSSIQVNDAVEIDRFANVESAYAELSLSDVTGKYAYHLIGEEASAKIKMAALSSHQYKKSYEVSLLHSAKATYGEMNNYGVVKDQGHLFFDGIGHIEKGYSQSATHQTSRIMVFDKECVAKANPYLFIDEYDVKASHAAGVGRMDEEHLFYLQSRGMTKNDAMRLITYGYLIPVVDVIDNETVKQAFNETLEKRMGH